MCIYTKQPLTMNESDFKMASFKNIELTPVSIKRLQIAFDEANCIAQSADENIQAATHDIKLMLLEPDNVWIREHIKTLCVLIEHNSFDAMSAVGSFVEDAGTPYANKKSSIGETVIYPAALQLDIQATLP